MISWSLTFLAIAVASAFIVFSGAFGLGGIMPKILFGLSLCAFLATFIKDRRPPLI